MSEGTLLGLDREICIRRRPSNSIKSLGGNEGGRREEKGRTIWIHKKKRDRVIKTRGEKRNLRKKVLNMCHRKSENRKEETWR